MMIKIFSVLLLILCTTLCMEMQHDDTCSKNIRLFSSSDGGLADPFKMICTDAMSLFEAGLMESCFRPEPEHPFFMSLKTIYLTDGAYKRLIERQMQLDNIYGDVKLSVHKMTSIKYPCTCAELHSYVSHLGIKIKELLMIFICSCKLWSSANLQRECLWMPRERSPSSGSPRPISKMMG